MSDRPIAVTSCANLAGITRVGIANGDVTRAPVGKGAVVGMAEPAWLEPIDVEAVDTDAAKIAALAEAAARFLPDWCFSYPTGSMGRLRSDAEPSRAATRSAIRASLSPRSKDRRHH